MHSEYVYVLKAGDYYKIGRTNEFSKRIAQLKIQLPFDVELFKVINTNDSARLEKHFHRLYSKLRANGEWFILPAYDAAVLLLYPASVDVNHAERVQGVLDAAKKIIANMIDQVQRDREIEQLIEDESSLVFNDIPDSVGNIMYADLLAAECPYPLDTEDMEWLVGDDAEEQG